MKRNFIALTFCTLTAIATSSHALSLNDVLGGSSDSSDKTTTAGTPNIDSITSAAIGDSTINPLVTLAANQLGIPSEYIPQIQQLYELYSEKGDLVSSDILSIDNLANWLSSAATNLDADTLANGLNRIFDAS